MYKFYNVYAKETFYYTHTSLITKLSYRTKVETNLDCRERGLPKNNSTKLPNLRNEENCYRRVNNNNSQ